MGLSVIKCTRELENGRCIMSKTIKINYSLGNLNLAALD